MLCPSGHNLLMIASKRKSRDCHSDLRQLKVTSHQKYQKTKDQRPTDLFKLQQAGIMSAPTPSEKTERLDYANSRRAETHHLTQTPVYTEFCHLHSLHGVSSTWATAYIKSLYLDCFVVIIVQHKQYRELTCCTHV